MRSIAHSPKKSRHPFAQPFSERRIREMGEAERRGPILARVYASDLPLGSTEQIRLVQGRIAAGSCLECGATLTDGGNFCVTCLKPFPIVEDIGDPVEGWQYRVRQLKPAYMREFFVERTDAFPPERNHRSETLCLLGGRAEA